MMKQKIRLLANSLFRHLWLIVSAFIFFRLSAQGLAAPIEFDPGGQIGTTLGLGTANFETTVIKLTQWVLSLLGLVGVVMMIAGGYIYLTAGGNEEKVNQAVSILENHAKKTGNERDDKAAKAFRKFIEGNRFRPKPIVRKLKSVSVIPTRVLKVIRNSTKRGKPRRPKN